MKKEQIKFRESDGTFRWLWWALLAVALAAAVGYLRVTLLAPLGGDDQLNNLTGYYEVTHNSVWAVLRGEWENVWKALTLQGVRFFPFSSLPNALRYWLKSDISTYRMYIIAHTLVDGALLGLLVSKATGRKALGGALFALLPLMLCLWSHHSTNGMYSYEALPQMALFPALLAGLCMTALHRTGHVRWAVLGALFTFFACGTYEIGYTYILMLGILALLLEKKFWRAVRLGLPFLAGELVALFYYVMSSRLNSGGQGYDGTALSMDPGRILYTWLCQMSGAFPLNTMLFSGVHPNSLTVGDVVWPLVLAASAVGFLMRYNASLSGRQAGYVFLMGLVMLAGPAALIAVSAKYQANGWVSTVNTYIPAVVESFGVAVMMLVILALLFQWARRRSAVGEAAVAVAVLLCLTGCGAFQRAATRERYDNGQRDTYEFLVSSVQAGLAEDVPEESPLVCEFNVWGGDKHAQEAFFLRYGDCRRNAYHVDAWEAEPQPNGEPIYFLCYIRNYEGYDTAWMAHVTDDMTRYADSVKVYIQGDKVPADAALSYITLAEDGAEVWHEVSIDRLPQTEPDKNGDYFVTLEDENIVSRRISLWAAGTVQRN